MVRELDTGRAAGAAAGPPPPTRPVLPPRRDAAATTRTAGREGGAAKASSTDQTGGTVGAVARAPSAPASPARSPIVKTRPAAAPPRRPGTSADVAPAAGGSGGTSTVATDDTSEATESLRSRRAAGGGGSADGARSDAVDAGYDCGARAGTFAFPPAPLRPLERPRTDDAIVARANDAGCGCGCCCCCCGAAGREMFAAEVLVEGAAERDTASGGAETVGLTGTSRPALRGPRDETPPAAIAARTRAPGATGAACNGGDSRCAGAID